jgi:hypothetical protein
MIWIYYTETVASCPATERRSMTEGLIGCAATCGKRTFTATPATTGPNSSGILYGYIQINA